MDNDYVFYQKRWVPKENFRVFIYDVNENKRLVNSYDEYETQMASGVWFASVQDVKKLKEVEKENVAPKVAKVNNGNNRKRLHISSVSTDKRK